MTSNPNCIHCGNVLTATSATAFICRACGIVEFGSTPATPQPQPQDKKH